MPQVKDYVSVRFDGEVVKVVPKKSQHSHYTWTEVWIKNPQGLVTVVAWEESVLAEVVKHRPWPTGQGSVIKVGIDLLALGPGGWIDLTDGGPVEEFDTQIEIISEKYAKDNAETL